MTREPKPSHEQTPEQQIAQLLKDKDPEAQAALTSWTIAQERLVEASTDPEARIQFTLKQARLYLESGYVDEAIASFEAALTQAWQERQDELHQKITKELDRVKSSLDAVGAEPHG